MTATFVFLEQQEAPGALETHTGTPGSAWVWDDSERSVLVRRQQDVLRIATLMARRQHSVSCSPSARSES